MPDIRADFGRREVVDTHAEPWQPSPAAGVERRLLDRIGDELARATSIVRYAPGSRFAAHDHALGEEFLVLEGVFEDEHGRYPAGTYVRNPPGTRHTPGASEGCTIFVKLRQFPQDDLRACVIDTHQLAWTEGPSAGVRQCVLHATAHETVTLLHFDAPAEPAPVRYPGGMECLVLAGSLSDERGHYPVGCWLRLPPGSVQQLRGTVGSRAWIKTGHLVDPA